MATLAIALIKAPEFFFVAIQWTTTQGCPPVHCQVSFLSSLQAYGLQLIQWIIILPFLVVIPFLVIIPLIVIDTRWSSIKGHNLSPLIRVNGRLVVSCSSSV